MTEFPRFEGPNALATAIAIIRCVDEYRWHPTLFNAIGVASHSPGSRSAPWDTVEDICSTTPTGLHRDQVRDPLLLARIVVQVAFRARSFDETLSGFRTEIGYSNPGCAAARRPWAIRFNPFGVELPAFQKIGQNYGFTRWNMIFLRTVVRL